MKLLTISYLHFRVSTINMSLVRALLAALIHYLHTPMASVSGVHWHRSSVFRSLLHTSYSFSPQYCVTCEFLGTYLLLIRSAEGPVFEDTNKTQAKQTPGLQCLVHRRYQPVRRRHECGCPRFPGAAGEQFPEGCCAFFRWINVNGLIPIILLS